MRFATVLILALCACVDAPAEESAPAAADTTQPFQMPDSTETSARAEAWLREGRLVEVRERLFTASGLDTLESRAAPGARVEVRPETLRLLVGEAFPLGELRVALAEAENAASVDTAPGNAAPGDTAVDDPSAETAAAEALPVTLTVRGSAATIVGATLRARAAGDGVLLVGLGVGGGAPDTVRVRVSGEP